MEKRRYLPFDGAGKHGRTSIVRAVFSVGLLLASSSLSAGPYQQRLEITAEAEANSNPEMLPTDEQTVWLAIFTPDYHLQWLRGENELLARARLKIERSSDTRLSANREYPLLSLQWTSTIPQGEFRLMGSFEETPTRISEFDDTGRVFADATQTKWALETGWDRFLTERLKVDMTTGYSDVSYDGGRFTDYSLADVGANLAYLLTETGTPYVQLNASRYEPDDTVADFAELSEAGTAESYQLVTGLMWQLNAFVDTDINVGGTLVDEETSDTGYIGSAKLNFQGEKLRGGLDYARAVAGSGDGGFLKSDSVTARVSYKYSPVMSFGGSASWRKNLDDLDNKTTRAELWADRELAEHWFFRTSWRFQQQKSEFKSHGHIVNFSLRYDLPEI